MAVDRSEAALAVAAENARRLGLTNRIDLRVSRWLDAIETADGFDVIVSNPPYVARADAATLPREVRAFEPEMALFADASDDLSSYKEITRSVLLHLRSSGLLALEVGMGQADRVAELIRVAGLESVEVLDDLARIPRVVLGRKP
jgi:release factor glutamine methyltransferase